MPKNWDEISASEKAEFVCDALEHFISFQNGANARMSERIKVLEEARTGTAQS
jgi:hypothetical protein